MSATNEGHSQTDLFRRGSILEGNLRYIDVNCFTLQLKYFLYGSISRDFLAIAFIIMCTIFLLSFQNRTVNNGGNKL